jgi:hypothetical protein
MDVFGNRHRVGNPPFIGGSLVYPQADARDMEIVNLSGSLDIAVVDRFGIVTYVENPGSTPAQSFGPFASPFATGQAVDVEVTDDGQGFWVLTDAAAIYRAGSALPTGGQALLGNDADNMIGVLPQPFGAGARHPGLAGLPNDNATLRAVGFAVVQGASADAPIGYIVIDSQGGSYLYNGTGVSIRNAGGTLGGATNTTVNGILNPSTVYPFFGGLDIARDIELHPQGTETAGLAIYDGWGGIHPVPVAVESPVRFLRNQQSLGGPLITTVGMPYLVMGFNDPNTAGNEADAASYPIDANSIFADIEFCQDGSEGAYAMDKFGGIFAFGTTRVNPDNLAPAFISGPYFFPYLYGADMEPVLNPPSK